MFHYCKTCLVNNHCQRCCPVEKPHLKNEPCPICRQLGHISKDCCPHKKGTLQYMERNFAKK